MTRHGRSLLVLTTLLALGAPLLAACSDDADPLAGMSRSGTVWTAEGVTLTALGRYNQPAVWSGDDLLVTATTPGREPTTRLSGLDPEDGQVRWSQDLDGALCDLSSGVDDAGRGAVLLGDTIGYECDRVAMIDTTTGDVLWTRDLPAARERPNRGVVEIGDRVVTATGDCGQVLRFAVDDGRPMSPIGSPTTPRFGTCDGPGGVGVGVVAYRDAPRRGVAETVLLDPDDGTELWRRPSARQVNAVVSSDPLVLDVTERGHRVLRTFDDRGRPGATLGFELDVPTQSFTVLASADGVVVGTYDEFDLVYAFDAATGELLWKRPYERFGPQRHLVGQQGDGLVWIQGAKQDDGRSIVVTRTGARDPDDGVTVGAIGGEPGVMGYLSASSLWFATGDLLLTPTSDSIDAYRIDGDGDGPVTEVPEAQQVDRDEVEWADDDVRTDEVGDACTAVSPRTLSLLGLPEDVPSSLLCQWNETARGVRRDLQVSVTAVPPDSASTGAERASQQLEQERSATTQAGAQLLPADGVGDEAFASTDLTGLGADDGYGTPLGSSSVLLVRQGNTIVRVNAGVSATLGATSRSVSRDQVGAAALAAAGDVLASLERPLDRRPTGAPAPVTAVPDACRVLDAAGSRLVPGVAARDLTVRAAEGTAGGCSWTRTYRRELVVTTLAVSPDPISGAEATDAAAALVSAAPGEPRPGVGDQAVGLRTSQYGDVRSTVLARRDNLVVVVRFLEQSAGYADDDAGLGRLDRVARQVLATARD